MRADQLLVDLGLVESRTRAQALILAGKVYSGTRRVEKAGQPMPEGAALEVKGQDHPWVSRGGLKLAHGLAHFGFDPTDRVCLDVGAGGLHLEVGPLEGLPPFVKKLRVIGNQDWDGLVLATNARTRPTRLPVRPGTGPWRWVAVGFEEDQDLGVERLAAEALTVVAPIVFRVDVDGVGYQNKSATLSLGQAYRLLLPPNVGDSSLGATRSSKPGGTVSRSPEVAIVSTP